MDALSNVSSIPNLDVEDDKEQIGAIDDARNQAMDALSNVSLIPNLDVEDDKEQIGAINAKNQDDREQIGAIDDAKTEGANKKKGGVSAKRGSKKDDKSVGGEYKKPLVWIDLEMTGLDVEVGRILEIDCIVTDGKLTKSVEGPDLVISQPKESLDNRGEWCRTHHAANVFGGPEGTLPTAHNHPWGNHKSHQGLL